MSNIDKVVRLRSPEPKDAKTIYKWENNTENWQYGSSFAPVSLSKIENFIRHFNNDIFAEKQHRFMIDLYITDMPPKTIGTIDLYDLDAINRRVGVGILIDEKVVADLIEFNRVQRAYLGVKINDIDSKFAEQHNIKVLKGVYVAEVMDDGPAEEAGMKTGDIIVSIDETNVNSSSELLELIGRHRPGDHVRVGVNRKSEISYLTVELRNSDNTTQLISKDEISVTPKLGITVENASQDLLNKLNISYGVQITNIERNSVIAGAGVKKGFVILELDRKPVRRVEDIARILEGRRGAILMEGIYPNGVKAYYAFGL
jgi:S1-C subfamily serine protease